MKTINFLIFILLSNFAFAQNSVKEKAEIEKIVTQFKKSIIQKDSVTFYGLFHEDPVVWIGLVKNKSQQKRLELNPSKTKNYFKGSYQNFFSFILKKEQKEEKFENIKIVNDDVIASVTFDYSFWIEGKMNNWGSESWHLIKANGNWKIVSIIYSIEDF